MKLTLPVDPIGSNPTPLPLPSNSTPPNSIAIDSTESSAGPNGRSELLLVCEARSTTLTDGYWRFALETAGGEPVLDAEDVEMGDLNRLTLLAAVRGLEAIEGASSVTLLSNNRYLIRSLSDSLPRWRQNNFMWEHFGRRIDVQHGDLWRRVDRALQIHRVEACLVSSRLVSAGQSSAKEVSGADSTPTENAFTRIDAAHQHGGNRSAVPAPKRRSRTTAPGDRLRSWLLANTDSGGGAPPQRRFTSRDLVEST